MKDLIYALIIGALIIIGHSVISDLHSRVITLEQDLEYTRQQVQEHDEYLFRDSGVVEVGHGGWLRLVKSKGERP